MTEATCLVKTESCYAAVFDTASPANTEGLMGAEFEQAKDEARSHPDLIGAELFILNSRLSQRATAGELLAWTLLFDGVFKTQLSVLPAIRQPSALRSNDNLGARTLVGDLLFPSGNIAVACLGKTGDESIQPVIHVEPGKYRVRVQQHPCESDHEFLEWSSDYPPADGADWTITLARLPA